MIPVFRPTCSEEEIESVARVLRSGWWGLGPKTREFEKKFADFVGSPCAVALNSATAGLHLGLMILGVERKEVITTPMTFVSTNHAILYNHAKPVFADIEPDTLNIDPDDIARKMNPRVAAIVVVHYGGHAADMDRVREIAEQYKVPVLEDAAHACGALYKGKRIGSLAEVTAFSFHAVKNLATGDGGMVTVTDSDYDKRLRQLRWLGINKDTWMRSDDGESYSWAYNVEELGFKYHMNDITAAIGLVQLAKLDQTNGRRRDVARRYSEAFGNLGWMEIPVEKSYATSSWHNYVVKVADRDRFMKFLNARGISTGMHYIPNHLYEMYRPYRTSLPIADAVWKRLVTLPLYPGMSESEVGLIIDTVTAYEA